MRILRTDDRWLVRFPLVLALVFHFGVDCALGFQSPQSNSSPPPKPDEVESDPSQRAVETLRYLADVVGTFRSPEEKIIGSAVIAEALAVVDEGKARDYFRQAYALLQKLQKEGEETGPLDARAAEARKNRLRELRTELVSRIQRVSPALARELTRTRDEESASSASDNSRPQRRRASQRQQAAALMAQALQTVDTDLAAAVILAQQSLALGVAPNVSSFLIRLQQTDSTLADRLFDVAFASATRILPPVTDDLMALAPYVFPAAFLGRQQRPTDPTRAQLFLQALTTSFLYAPWLDNPSGDQMLYNQAARQYLTYQRMLPLYQRFAPSLVDDINETMDKAMASVPGNYQNKLATASTPGDPVQALTRSAEDEKDPRLRDELYAEAAITAAGKGDLARAKQLKQRIINSQLRQETDEQITIVGAQAAIDQEDWAQLRKLALEIKDPLIRADMLIQAASRLTRKKETEQAATMLNEAYSVLTPLDSSETKARHLFTIATSLLEVEPLRVFEVAQAGVIVLNKLNQPAKDEEKASSDAKGPLTPKSIRQELEAAFGRLGRADFERAIQVSTQLQNMEQRVVAQAVSCRAILLGQAKAANPAKRS
ncbi:MAG: hypothetical protein HY314_04620 [Acidobacteria bacterium]|nr:hypothetical protein [Acidobacteriota bacterium]